MWWGLWSLRGIPSDRRAGRTDRGAARGAGSAPHGAVSLTDLTAPPAPDDPRDGQSQPPTLWTGSLPATTGQLTDWNDRSNQSEGLHVYYITYTALQSQKAVTAYLKSKQVLSFDFVQQYLPMYVAYASQGQNQHFEKEGLL